jgi:hypothetical protein
MNKGIPVFKSRLEISVSQMEVPARVFETRPPLAYKIPGMVPAGLTESHYLETWGRLENLTLGAELIVATFGQDEPVIMRIAGDANVYWEDGFSTIGSGGPIAETFMVQRFYDGDMPLEECLARVWEAKVAAEKNQYVGQTTNIEVMVFESTGARRFAMADKASDAYENATRSRMQRMPRVKFPGSLLEPITDEDDPRDSSKGE